MMYTEGEIEEWEINEDTDKRDNDRNMNTGLKGTKYACITHDLDSTNSSNLSHQTNSFRINVH